MNEEHDASRDDATPDAGLDASEDARIRALLAELGAGPGGEPIPPEVEARLDDTLARLVAERGRTGDVQLDDHLRSDPEDEGASASASDNVVPLRRRWLPRAAVAAAAVIMLGAGSVAVANLALLSRTGESTSSDSAGESAGKSTADAPDPDSGSGSGSDPGTGAAALPELSAASFARDVEILLEGRAPVLTPEGQDAEPQSPRKNRDNAQPGAPGALTSAACPGPEVTDGAVSNPVRYDDRPAVLLIHPERAGRQVVEAWNCAGNRRLASATLTR